MKIFSKRFNTELEFSDELVIRIPWGLPGFPDSQRFCILDMEDAGSPFKWLHDIDNTEVALLITDPYHFFSDYNPEIQKAVIDDLGIEKIEEDLMVFTIVKITKGGQEAFTNLRAPVIVNAKTRVARQVILEDDTYAVKTALFSIAEEQQQVVNS